MKGRSFLGSWWARNKWRWMGRSAVGWKWVTGAMTVAAGVRYQTPKLDHWFGLGTGDRLLDGLLLIGVVLAVVVTVWPRRSLVDVRTRASRNTRVQVRIGDLLAGLQSGHALVVPTNIYGAHELQDEGGRIRDSSVQGKYTRLMRDSHEREVISEAVAQWQEREPIVEQRYGTVIKMGRPERRAYWIAVGGLLEEHDPVPSWEDYLFALSSAWREVGRIGEREVMWCPIVGHGQLKMAESAEQLVLGIIQTFLETRRDIAVSDDFRLVITADAASKMDLVDLREQVEGECRRERREQQRVQRGGVGDPEAGRGEAEGRSAT